MEQAMSIIIKNVQIPDFENDSFIKKSVKIENGIISEISESELNGDTVIDGTGNLLSPGLIDCHCHIESSLLTPEEFGNNIMKLGTLHAVADCHEISNVAGAQGLDFFMENARLTECNIKFAIPSCVPATSFATSGGAITLDDVNRLIKSDDVVALGELMNIPAVINRDKNVLDMIKSAKTHSKRINGHAPGLSGETLKKYISAGIEDDHESETYEELKEKIEAGLNVFLREGSAEQTEDSAYKIINEYPDRVMFCTDDKSINHILSTGHINFHLKKAVQNGVPPLKALKCASYNGLKYYGMESFAEIKEGTPAFLVLFEDMVNFMPKTVIVNDRIYSQKKSVGETPDYIRNSFSIEKQLRVPAVPDHLKDICIKVNDGSLITDKIELSEQKNEIDLHNDILKIAVFERYGYSYTTAAKINGFGLKKGAIASSLAHDCHNIIAVGTCDEAILKAVNKIIDEKGGLSVFDGENVSIVPLHIGGVVSNMSAEELSSQLEEIKQKTISLGCSLSNPFATLSFMALEVIPHIKITDQGLFDVDSFSYL